ncbi:hypothetical protein SAMN06295967_11459 [Belliella buryatensis]|uniref:Carbonic anhydrase n=1 Tax=Belliella buryatensis TaxID=1500549 RepID=A0A239G0H8_9BACT|nr:hypothetical protein [Belliella buryatensis]SNS62661.1 hypothetical protein SAMN06295967_11459 [Belliella buryatensis]
MKNNLFLICPFSNSEQIIKKELNQNAFFMTGMGGFLSFDDLNFCVELNRILINNQIDQFFLVQNTSCRFLKEALEEDFEGEYPVQKIYQNLYIDNFYELKTLKSDFDRKVLLAQAMIKTVAENLFENPILSQSISNYGITVKGSIIDPGESKISTFKLNESIKFV